MKRFVVAAVFGVLVSSGAVLWAGPSPHMADAGFGMIGVAAGQTLRVSIVNIDDPNTCPESSMQVQFSFAHPDGTTVAGREGQPIAMKAVLMAGQAAFLDLAVPTDSFRSRMQVRPVGRSVDNPDYRPSRGCLDAPLVPTAEVFDTESGRTQFLYPGQAVYFKEVDPGKPSTR